MWSGLQPKNGPGDHRECPTTACSDTQGYAGDPINTRTGGFDYTWVDLSLPTTAGPLVFQRTYASPVTNTYTTTLGYGWTHNMDTQLITPTMPGGEPNVIWFKAHSANQYRFTDNGNGTYTPYNGVLASLTASTTPTTTYTLTNSAQAVYTFDWAGKLTNWKDPQNHQFNYLYDLASGRLLTVTEPVSQRYLSFQYTDQQNPNRLTSVRDHTGRHVDFGYNAAGDLTSVIDVLGQTWTYTYDTTHRLTDVKDPNDTTIPTFHIDYDASGRAWKQYDGLNKLIVEVTYTGNTATITNTNGITETHLYNNLNTLTSDNGPLGSALGKSYDVNFRPAVITDSLTHPMTLTWSADGANLTNVQGALQQTTQLSYDSFNNLTRVVDARALTTTFAYSGTLLTVMTDTLTNRTLYTYTTAADAPQPPNLLKAMTDALGRTTSYEYDPSGQLSVITDTASIVTRYQYDNLGRVVTTTVNLGTPLQQINVNQYDPAGRIIQTIRNQTLITTTQNYLNRYNLITQYAYDAVGNRTVMTDTVGRVSRNVYDNNNRLTQTTQNVWSGQPQNYLFQYNLITTYSYNDLGLQEWMTDTVGRVTRSEYDALNRPVTVTVNYEDGDFTTNNPNNDKDIRTITQYDANGNVVSVAEYANVSGLARTTRTEYDPLNRPVTVTVNYEDGDFTTNNPNSDKDIRTVTEYDANGNVVSVTEYANVSGLARTTLTDYDPLNRPISTTVNYAPGSPDPDKNLTSLMGYNTIGEVVTTTAFAFTSLARLARTGYDPFGRPVTTTTNYTGSGAFDPNHPDQNLTQITGYGPAGERAATTELRGAPGSGTTLITTTYSYDNLGRLITTTVPLTGTAVASTTVTYDPVSRVADSVDPLGQKTHTDYDALDRPITVTANYKDGVFTPGRPDEDLITVYAYDAVGNLTQVRDPKGIVTKFEYDLLNRLTAVVENYVSGGPMNAQTNVGTTYLYDAAGNLKTITDGRQKNTQFTYDLLNRLASTTDPLSHTTQYGYDAAGNWVRVTDANGQVITYIYDLLNRLVGIDYPAPDADVTFTYDKASQRTAMADGLGTTSWGYDGMSRPLTITQPFVGSVIYGYDSASNRLSLKYPDGKVVTSTYDLASRLVQVRDWQTQATNYAYDSASRLTALTLSNGITSTYGYDGANRLLALTHQTQTQTVASYAYTLDAAGNRVQAVENVQPPPAGAIAVNATSDVISATDGRCTLREAVRAANLNTASGSAPGECPAGGSAPAIALPSGTYTLTVGNGDDTALQGDLDITRTVTISGAGADVTVIKGKSGWTDRVFHVFASGVQISGVTIRDGNHTSSTGGGVRVETAAALTLSGVTVMSNTTTSNGGGIYTTGVLTVTHSALLANTSTTTSAGGGGGLYVGGGTATLTNVTFSGNQAKYDGGGLRASGTLTLTLNNVTLTNNTADSDANGTGDGGGLRRASGTVNFKNTLIAKNLDNSTTTKHPDCSGTVTSQGYNLVGIDTGCTFTTQTGDQRGTSGSPIDPKLSPLQDNGGSTPTHAPLFGSPAMDAGNPAAPGSGGNACDASDQRGTARPADGDGNGSARCDIGAVEAALPGSGTLVTTTADDLTNNGNCSLREAIRAANLNAAVDACPAGSSTSMDTIIVPSGTYTLTRTGSDDTSINGDLDITGPTTLLGVGANLTIITAGSGWSERIIHVLNATVSISGVTLRNGNSGTSSGGGLRNEGGVVTLSYSAVISNTAPGDDGGGLHNTNGGTLTLLSSTVMSNTTGLGFKGAGIFNNAGTLTLVASAVVSNTAGDSGGGVYNDGGTATIVNSTLSGNRANDDGGGIRNTSNGTVTLSNVTLTNNTADADGDGVGNGGGIEARSSGTVTTLRNTILAGNQDNSPLANDKRPDCHYVVTSQGYNILGNNTGCTYTSSTGDQVGTGGSPIDPKLGPLQNNGGPTLTHALNPGSPAIDKGSPAGVGTGGSACETTDQRRLGLPADGDGNGSALCDVGAYEVGAFPVTTIAYTYDPLYRLTAANYNDGRFFRYGYDAVGNRLTQTTLTATTVYTYDDANRLINVGGVNYTWDNNGNLTGDGASTYAYDSANRLRTLTQGANTYTFGYNGLGDRLQQTINGNTTTYVLDLNAGLTQVLADGTNTYLYGLNRVGEQQPGGFVYHLPDALGSVRQLTNASRVVTLARSDDPYGNMLASAGTGTTNYNFAGEWRDNTGLLHLRARYYGVQWGRFLTADSWGGNYRRPLTLNRWNYVNGNPINYTDPSGQCIFGGIDTALCLGLLIGGGIEYGRQVYRNYQRGLRGQDAWFRCIAWEEVAIAALKGELAGGAAFLLAPLAPFAESGGLLGHVVGGAWVGETSSVAAQLAFNALSGQPLGRGVPQAAVSGAIAGGVGGAVAWGASRVGEVVTMGGRTNAPREAGVVQSETFCSFSADTVVTTGKGKQVISSLQPGDLVLAYDEAIRAMGLYTVTAVLEHTDAVIERITIAGETLETTPEHPFYTQERGWVPAGELWAGAHLRKANGSYDAVEAVVFVLHPQTMYNLAIAQAHTFFVGQWQWLVHNDCRWLIGASEDTRELGERLAGQAKDYLRYLKTSEKGSITIAVAEVEGRLVVTVNGGALPSAANTIAPIVRAEGGYFYQAPGRMHAEEYLYRTFSGDGLDAIGVSHYGGPCDRCRPFFYRVGFRNVYWDDTYVP